MKNLFRYIVAGMTILATVTSCEDNENWRVIPYEPEPSTEPLELLVVGNHQGWNPGAEVIGKIYSVDNGEVYSGYVYLNGDFKCCSEPSWDGTNYGIADGVISTDSEAGNLNAAEEGYYFLTLDLVNLTYSVERREWGIIGDATPGGWNEDVDLVYDAADLKLKANVTLVDGTMKFRANDAWEVNLGGDVENLVLDGDNINVTAGDYQVVLDLSTPTYKAELIQ